MTAFAYTARDRNGKPHKGIINAHNTADAWRTLRRANLQPEHVSSSISANTKKWWKPGSNKLSQNDSVSVTRQLAMLIKAGTPIERALHTVAEAASAHTKSLVQSVRVGVVQGESVADALKRAGFAPFYRAIIRAGEQGGGLEDAFERLASHLETSQTIRRKLLASLAYPAVLAIVAITVVTALMVLVVPKLAEHLADLGQQLPLVTRIIVGLSEWIGTHSIAILTTCMIGCSGIWWLARSYSVHIASLIWSMPLIGQLMRDAVAARFCRALAALIHSGIPVTDALHIAAKTSEHPLARAGLRTIRTQVDNGQPLGIAIENSGVFPNIVAQMISGGEASGALAPLFDKSAQYLESRVSSRTATLLAITEPLIAVVMGIIVLIVVLAIMLPILRLNAAVLP